MFLNLSTHICIKNVQYFIGSKAFDAIWPVRAILIMLPLASHGLLTFLNQWKRSKGIDCCFHSLRDAFVIFVLSLISWRVCSCNICILKWAWSSRMSFYTCNHADLPVEVFACIKYHFLLPKVPHLMCFFDFARRRRNILRFSSKCFSAALENFNRVSTVLLPTNPFSNF